MFKGVTKGWQRMEGDERGWKKMKRDERGYKCMQEDERGQKRMKEDDELWCLNKIGFGLYTGVFLNFTWFIQIWLNMT